MKTLQSLRLSLLGALCAGALIGPAGAVSITREFTASWYDPAHSGHGFNFEVIGSGASKTMLGYWYTYDAQGKPSWMFATGPVVGDQAQLTGYATLGGAFGNSFDPRNVQVQAWGTLNVDFDDCNHGTVHFNPNDPALVDGSMPITRLTSLYNSSCSGGVSDDTNGSSAGSEITQFMTNTGAVGAAQAKLRFEERTGRTDFNAEAEDLPVGAYSLRVDGSDRGTINVRTVVGGTEGEIEFRSPVEPGKVLLDFDPRGKIVTLSQGSTIFFTTTFGSNTPPDPGPGTGNGAPPFGNAVYSLTVEPSGNDGPELSAKLEQRSNRVDFKVEVEDTAVGSYQVRIGGTLRGTVQVIAVPGGTNGELEFRNPIEPGKQLLDFDPRGQLVEIVSGSNVVLSGSFPNTPNSPLPGDDTGGGGNGGGSPGGTPPNATFSINMTRTSADADATGMVDYSAVSGEVEFEVEIEDLPDGNYRLVVGGSERGTINSSDGRGKIRFKTPTRPDRLPLDFNPRGQHIEVLGGSTLYLSADLP
jgi:hypothetical protein